MIKTLVIAEHANGKLNSGLAKVLSAAKAIGGEIDVAVFSDNGTAIAEEVASYDGVSRVLQVDRAENNHLLAALIAPQVIEVLGRGYTHLLASGSVFGKDLLPRVSAKLGVQQVSDIMAIHSPTCFDRLIYAGNAMVTVGAPSDPCIVATVRLASFGAVPQVTRHASIESVSSRAELPSHTIFVRLEQHLSARPDLQSASRVVAGGRALGSIDNFKMICDLADKIQAAVGATRAAVDSGYAPNEIQVGQTGKIIAPELYIAVGISGAVQHLAGIKDAGTIVAINSDPNAPIFSVADYGLVGDLFQVIPELERKL